MGVSELCYIAMTHTYSLLYFECVRPIKGLHVWSQRGVWHVCVCVCVCANCVCFVAIETFLPLFFSAEVWGDATEAGDVIS